jgi:hypothetical protein
MSTTLNQRNIGDILGDTFRIYGRHFWKLLAITAIVLGVLGVIETVAGFGLLNLAMTWWWTSGLPGWLIAVPIILIVANFVGRIFMGGALIHAVSEQYLRQGISIHQAYSFAWRRLGAMIGAGLLALLAIGGINAISALVAAFSWIGWILVVVCVCASIYLGICWVFIFPVALLEGLGPIAALSRSYSLVKNSWWRVLGITLVVSLIFGAISVILGMIPVVGTIIGSVLAAPIFIIANTLLYYDLRVRKEKYTLKALSSELHIEIEGNIT